MSGDLLTLRMMLVSASAGTERQWREGAALASVPIEFSAERTGDAIKLLNRGGFDIVVVDAALPGEARASAISAARLGKPAPLVALLGGSPVEGADLVVAPAIPNDLLAEIERCIRLRLPKRTLIVDDSRTMRGIVRKILSASRFALEISEAEDGREAVQKVADRYDLVLLDCNMPEVDGFAILAEIRKTAPNTTVVMMSSTDDEAVARRAKEAGANVFLKKPFYPADIDATLVRIFGAQGG